METLTGEQLALLAAAAVVTICLAGVVIWRMRRRRATPRPAARPVPLPSTPYLESPDGRVRLPLERLAEPGLVIGRAATADLSVDASLPHVETVAACHARIYRDAASGCVLIEDLDSATGVFVNGRRAPRKNLLRDRWVIGLGQLTLVYRDGNTDTGPLE